MKNFLRVLRLAFRNRVAIAASVVCSLLVGVLWGANIATLYPVVEVMFRGDSLHQWAEQRVEARQEGHREVAAEIRQLQLRLPHASDEQHKKIRARLDFLEPRLASAAEAVAREQKLRRWIVRYVPDDAFLDLALVVAALVAGTVLKSLFLASHMILVNWIRQRTILDLRNELFRNTLDMDLTAFGEHRTSGLLSRFTHDIRCLEDGVGMLFGQAVREPLKMAACLAGAALISWQLLLLSLVVTPLGLLAIRWLTRSMKRASGRSMDVIAELYARLSEAFNGIKVVKAFTMEAHEQKRFQAAGREYVHRSMRFAAHLAFFKPVSETMGIAVVSLAVLLGAYVVLNQETHVLGIRIAEHPITPGALLVFFGMLAGIADPARKMSDIYSMIIAGMVAAERVYDVMDRVPSVRDPASPRTVPRPHRRLDIEHVSFHYQPGEPVLADLVLNIEFGETIALLGPNGCGKSTLANLVPRFFDPVQGAVRLDGVDLRELSLRDLRGRIGLVSQETLLFDDTIRNNILYGDPHASEERVVQAARQAHAHTFIAEQLEHGYDTVVGQGGSRLSGGQRQRIALARAILRDPEILILDEATSQIDIESEQLIHQALEHFTRDRTTILISHRLSTLVLADRIVVMDAGRIVACGAHAELYGDCEFYRQLHQTPARDVARVA